MCVEGGVERIVSFLDFAPPSCWWFGVSIVPVDGLFFTPFSSFWAQRNFQFLMQCYLEVLAFVLVIVIILNISITCTLPFFFFFFFFFPQIISIICKYLNLSLIL